MQVSTCYSKKPFNTIDGIPIFSKVNEYTENYEKIASDHISHMNKTGKNPFMNENYWKEIENSTKNLILKYSSGAKILDIGVGLGRLLDQLPSDKFEKYGIDISFEYLKISKQKEIEVSYALIEDMPYHDNFFDIVVCTDVLEHVLDLNLAVDKIFKVLKPNGLLIIRVPYQENLKKYLLNSNYKFVHLRNFDENMLILLFEKIFPFQYVEHSFTGYYHNYEKLKYKFLTSLFNYFVGFLRRVNRPFYKFLLKIFYNPNEINMVIKKTISDNLN